METVTKENNLRNNYFASKIYLNRARNPLNGEHTPREDDKPNVSEVTMNIKTDWFSPEVPVAEPVTFEKSVNNRQLERNRQLKVVRSSIDQKLMSLQQIFEERSLDVEQSLLKNRLSLTNS